MACNSRITSVSIDTITHRSMIRDSTFCINAASSGARIFTFIVYARFVARAIRIYYAFGPAARVRVAKIIWQTGTRTSTIQFFANGIRTARRRIARIPVLFHDRFFNYKCFRKRLIVRIENENNSKYISYLRNNQQTDHQCTRSRIGI